MVKNSKQTSKAVASKASRILKDGRYGKDSKSVAGSALAQTRPGKKKYSHILMGGDGLPNQPAHPLRGIFQIKSLSLNSAIRTEGCIRVRNAAMTAVFGTKMLPP